RQRSLDHIGVDRPGVLAVSRPPSAPGEHGGQAPARRPRRGGELEEPAGPDPLERGQDEQGPPVRPGPTEPRWPADVRFRRAAFRRHGRAPAPRGRPGRTAPPQGVPSRPPLLLPGPPPSAPPSGPDRSPDRTGSWRPRPAPATLP